MPGITTNAASVQGIPVIGTAPTEGQSLVYVSANSDYEPRFPVRCLYTQGTPTTVTGTLTETTLASFTLKGGAMGANGVLFIIYGFSATNNSNNKTFKIKIGSTALRSQTINTSGATVFAATLIANQGSQSVQVAPPSSWSLSSATAETTGAVDTSVDQTFSITCTLAVTTDTAGIDFCLVQLMRS